MPAQRTRPETDDIDCEALGKCFILKVADSKLEVQMVLYGDGIDDLGNDTRQHEMQHVRNAMNQYNKVAEVINMF